MKLKPMPKWTLRERWQNPEEFLLQRQERKILKRTAKNSPIVVHKVHQTAVTEWLARGWELKQSQAAGYVAGSMMVITISTQELRDRLGA